MARNKEKYRVAFHAALERTLKNAWVPLPPVDLERRCDWLLSLNPRGRELRARNAPEKLHPQVVSELISRSYELRMVDPRESLEYGQVAVDAARALQLGCAGQELAEDLRAEAWGNLANCLRLVDNIDAANEAWPNAAAHASCGSGDPLLAAHLALKEAVLRRVERRLCDAAALQTRAAALFARCGDGPAAGKSHLELAITHFHAEAPKQALAAAKQAAGLLDMVAEPEMALALYHNTLFFLEADGEYEMAFIVSGRIRWWYEVMESPLLLARYQWLRGRLALAAGATQTAANCADEARRTLLAEGQLFDAALAGFDACLAMLKNGSFLPAQRLATEMYTVFTSKDLPREAHAALLLFADAARSGSITVALADKVAGELLPVRKPGFKPASASAP